jgi:hypothetical protein
MASSTMAPLIRSNTPTRATPSILLRNQVSLGPDTSNSSLNIPNTRKRKLLNYAKLNKFGYNGPP